MFAGSRNKIEVREKRAILKNLIEQLFFFVSDKSGNH